MKEIAWVRLHWRSALMYGFYIVKIEFFWFLVIKIELFCVVIWLVCCK